ncbi:MAG: polymorphic toxin-type HINT domain-containing protein, partial [Nanoarchaeota archaeon]
RVWRVLKEIFSFRGDTAIMLANGSEQEIARLKVGDEVLSYDLNNYEIKKGKVDKIFVRNVTRYLNLTYVTEEGSYRNIYTTDEHPFYVNKKWVKAYALKKGDSLFTLGGTKVVILSVENIIEKNEIPVYNVHIDSFENYFAENVLVHNKPDIIWQSVFADAYLSGSSPGIYTEGGFKDHTFTKTDLEHLVNKFEKSEQLRVNQGIAAGKRLLNDPTANLVNEQVGPVVGSEKTSGEFDSAKEIITLRFPFSGKKGFFNTIKFNKALADAFNGRHIEGSLPRNIGTNPDGTLKLDNKFARGEILSMHAQAINQAAFKEHNGMVDTFGFDTNGRLMELKWQVVVSNKIAEVHLGHAAGTEGERGFGWKELAQFNIKDIKAARKDAVAQLKIEQAKTNGEQIVGNMIKDIQSYSWILRWGMPAKGDTKLINNQIEGANLLFAKPGPAQ